MSDTKHVWRVTHQAFKTEFVIAGSQEEARNVVAGGFDHGEYVYGEFDNPHPVAETENLVEIPGIGSVTVENLLNADSPIGLGPAAEPEEISRADATRLQNRLSEYPGRLGRITLSDVKRNLRAERRNSRVQDTGIEQSGGSP